MLHAEKGKVVVGVGRGQVEGVKGPQVKGLLLGEGGLDKGGGIGNGVDGAQLGAEQEAAGDRVSAVGADEDGTRGSGTVGEVGGDGTAVWGMRDGVERKVVADVDAVGQELTQLAPSQAVEGPKGDCGDELAGVTAEPFERVEGLCGMVGVDLETLDVLLPPATWHEALQHRGRPMQAHVPVAIAMSSAGLLEDGARDAGLVGAVSTNNTVGMCYIVCSCVQ